VYVPTSQPEQVTENGKTLNASEGVAFENAENGYAVVEVMSGKYEFVAPYN
jgi:hypothetical protein